MTTEEFCYWLQGFLDATGDNPMSKAKVRNILAMLELTDIEGISYVEGKD